MRANGFKTYIVTGGGQEFVRVYSQRVYGIPPEQVVGSSILTKYELPGRQTGIAARAETVLQRQLRRQGHRHQPVHRQTTVCRVWQLNRRSADARVDRRLATAHG